MCLLRIGIVAIVVIAAAMLGEICNSRPRIDFNPRLSEVRWSHLVAALVMTTPTLSIKNRWTVSDCRMFDRRYVEMKKSPHPASQTL